MNPDLSPDLLTRLRTFDSCSIANAVDAAGVRLANEGFCDDRITCRTPQLPPMVGIVVPLKVRSADPSMKKAFYLDQADWWERLDASPHPRILAVQDLDVHPGRGALIGPVHAAILQALGFVGVITDGAIRGQRKFGEIGLAAFASHLSPAHAFSHVVEFGAPIVLAGLALKPGDVVHGDEHGIVKIPADIADQIATLAADVRERERRVCDFCQTPDFSPAALRRRLGVDSSRR